METQEQQTPQEDKESQSKNTSVASAAKTAATAVSSAAKAAAGDVAGAIADLLKDENIRRTIVVIVLGALFLMMYGSMAMGSAITGTIENLQQGYLENYNQIYEDFAISANGSTFALYTFNHQEAQNEALVQTVVQTIEGLFKKESRYDNSGVAGGTNVADDDYRNTLNAVKDQEAFAGTQGALQKRLDMIKGRVEQRGEQLASQAASQYEVSGLGLAIGEYLNSITSDPILFAGVDLENSHININTNAFKMSDIQALKILAAYSIQNDCNLEQIDMWDLMNYCGWYASATEALPTTDPTNTIYDSSLTANYAMEIAGAVGEGEPLSSSIRKLQPPYVPYWDGSCAAQWYYEEIAQLRDHNERYDNYQSKGDTEKLAGTIRFEERSSGDIDISNFSKLSAYDTFGIVDKIYTSTSADLIVTRTEYHDASEWYREAIASFSGAIKSAWEKAFATSSNTTSGGNLLKQDKDGKVSFVLYTSAANQYYITRPATGWKSSTYTGRAGGSITFSGLSNNATYYVYEVSGPIHSPHLIETTKIDSFTTAKAKPKYEAYKLQLDVNVTFSSRSVDEMVKDVIGLWPGSLTTTQTAANGRKYADGYANNELLAYDWTDTYTDSSGNQTVVQFTRLAGYQAEAYEDYIFTIAEILGLDVSGLMGGGNGDTMVEIAMAELEYYRANNLYEGGRYWEMVRQATGVKYPDDTAWCVCFIMTCAWQCDLLGDGKAWDGVDWIYYCTGLYNELVNSGVATGYATRGSDYKPEPGDIVFFAPTVTNNGLHHVGLVKEVTEDGKLITIEGNKSNILKMDTYSSYRLGSHAYSDCVIAAYCHPTYPATYIQDPLYESVLGSISPSVNARLISNGDSGLVLAGIGRFRWSQLPQVLTNLKKSYPELYTEELQTAYDASDKPAFLAAWNTIARSSKKDTFKKAQRKLLNQLFVQPVAQAVKAGTGFDWKKTQVREELLLGIVSTTDQQQACIEVLKSLGGAFNNNTGDEELLNILKANNYLYNYMHANKDILWPEDIAANQLKWCSGIQSLLKKVTENQKKLVGNALYALQVNVTHYCACKICCGPNAAGRTASGKPVAEGMVAMSSYYPFGTQIMINNIMYTVEDRGASGIENDISRVDIYVPSHYRALQLGRYKTTAYIYRLGR